MKPHEIRELVNSAFDNSFSNWTKCIEKELYPSAFTDEYSWLRVKEALRINNSFLKESLIQSFISILSDE